MKTSTRKTKEKEPMAMVVRPVGKTSWPSRPDTTAARPGHEEIAQLAYLLWQDRGSPHGQDQDDWFQAVRHLDDQFKS